MNIRDHLDTLRWRAANGRTHVSNAWHRAVGHRLAGARTGFGNWRNLRAIQRGRRDVPARIGDQVRSRTPVVRSRINRATGRPHRDDREMGRSSDRSLARLAEGQRRLRDAEARRRASRIHPAALAAVDTRNRRNARVAAAEQALERQRQEPARARQYAQDRIQGRRGRN